MTKGYIFWVILILTMMTHSSFANETNEKEEQVLTFGCLPYITATALMEKYTPLADYLSQKLAIPVKLSVAKDYKEHIRRAGENELDITFIGGLPYVEMVEKYGRKRLFARYEMQNKPFFQSIIVVPKNSPIQSLKDLKGKRFAFGNKNSTLSTLVPRYMLQQEGIKLNDLMNYDHVGTHEDVILGVLLGSCDAGAVAQEVFNEHKSKYPIRQLIASPPVSTHLLVASDQLSDELFDKIQMALYNLKDDPNAKEILSIINKDMTGFVPVKDSDYDLLRNIVKSLDK